MSKLDDEKTDSELHNKATQAFIERWKEKFGRGPTTLEHAAFLEGRGSGIDTCMAISNDIFAKAKVADHTCSACRREESICSADPCAAVALARGS
jgi:hypothetical protein